MAEDLQITGGLLKEQIYIEILPQIKAVISDETNLNANLANISAILNQAFAPLWVGFYLYDADNQSLVLGPFQGPLACTRIPLYPKPRGVCGMAAAQNKTIIVDDVDTFDGHIACSSQSKSEIVCPLVVKGKTHLVLDIDSVNIAQFDATDETYLSQIIDLIKDQHFKNA